MTKSECVVVMAATGVCMLKGKDLGLFYEYIAEKVGRPVYSHELASEKMWEIIREKSKEDFIKICESAV